MRSFLHRDFADGSQFNRIIFNRMKVLQMWTASLVRVRNKGERGLDGFFDDGGLGDIYLSPLILSYLVWR